MSVTITVDAPLKRLDPKRSVNLVWTDEDRSFTKNEIYFDHHPARSEDFVFYKVWWPKDERRSCGRLFYEDNIWTLYDGSYNILCTGSLKYCVEYADNGVWGIA